MSRSGYVDDCENLELYRATVERAIKGNRGQEFLKELALVMDAMPEKTLIAGELISESGAGCAIGEVCKARSMDVSKVDYEDPDSVGRAVGISRSMAAEIEYVNDECGPRQQTATERWQRMRKWVADNLNPSTQ